MLVVCEALLQSFGRDLSLAKQIDSARPLPFKLSCLTLSTSPHAFFKDFYFDYGSSQFAVFVLVFELHLKNIQPSIYFVP